MTLTRGQRVRNFVLCFAASKISTKDDARYAHTEALAQADIILIRIIMPAIIVLVCLTRMPSLLLPPPPPPPPNLSFFHL